MFIKLFLLSVVILSIAFAGFAIKMFVLKNGQFKKQCSSSIRDPKTGKRLSCAGGSCHTSRITEEINVQKTSPISRRNIRIITEKAISE
ncbi:hypothetical protein LA303_05085 [Candidatus Sulfidibacterium hydrothermale]|uniref:hypothetical protein n=1 Tax=Candidatus Sulfidibacterium hydrothermale TaxID=2875962 RepID=UPI001F0B1856|nr:hypothetical protein [Candidatus Sulfidibacterium hydrothermale]UBM63347.1 hypothetical protein LA303_05085 [Candidatus Sulfidibacterium hydrothermale]